MDTKTLSIIALFILGSTGTATALLGIAQQESISSADAAMDDKECVLNVDKVLPTLDIALPTEGTFPSGFELKQIATARSSTSFYYWDKSPCDVDGGDPVYDGAIQIVAWKGSEPVNATKFAQDYIERYGDVNPTIQKVYIHGNIGIGKEVGEGKSVVIRDDKTISENDKEFPAKVKFYNEETNTWYNIRAFQPLETLLKIARSL